MSYTQHDEELAQLFATMNFQQPLPQHPATPDKQFIMQQQQPPHIIYTSQHYTGTAYLCPSEPIVDTRADSPLSFPVETIDDLLRKNGIDPASLSPSQSKLFTEADYDQRLRLLELWHISPPENGNHAIAQLNKDTWPLTSLAQEEELAQLRYQRNLREREQQDAFRRQHQVSRPGSSDAEPYVVSGYANNQRIDPVYAAAAGVWQAPIYTQAMQSTEDRYGATIQLQGSICGDGQRFMGMHGPVGDDEMMM